MKLFQTLDSFLEERKCLPSNCLFEMREELNRQDFYCNGFVKVSSLMRIFQKISQKDMFSNGLDVIKDIQNGHQWMVRNYKITIERTPLYHEEIKVFTWVSQIDKLSAIRNFLITQGNVVIAKAISQWIIFNGKGFEPMPVEAYKRNIWEMKLSDFKFSKITTVPSETSWYGKTYFYMVDDNHHMNNMYYGLLPTETVSRDFLKNHVPYDFEIFFKKGAENGDDLLIMTDQNDNHTSHSLQGKKEDEENYEELAQIKIIWKKS